MDVVPLFICRQGVTRARPRSDLVFMKEQPTAPCWNVNIIIVNPEKQVFKKLLFFTKKIDSKISLK